jgi:hypothetical protein
VEDHASLCVRTDVLDKAEPTIRGIDAEAFGVAHPIVAVERRRLPALRAGTRGVKDPDGLDGSS